MDFEKIHADFEAAKANHDLKKMSDLFTKVNNHCCDLLQAGRENEIPPSAIYIDEHTNALIYYVTKLLNDGEADNAKPYLLALTKGGIAYFDKFFYMFYLFGRVLYATGDYSRAMKIFNRYEQNRYARWNDLDELTLFYHANCAAMLGDFDTSARLYEQILTIKADFPEAKKNLKLVLRGSNENLVREVKSLWNFPYWRDVPIFINARDRLGVMKKLIDWLLDAGYRRLIMQVDTTFALYSNVRHYNLRFSLRTTGDLQAYHLPWYFDYDNLPDDEKYYLEHADKNSVTTVKNFFD